MLTTDLDKVLNFTDGSKRVAQIGTDLKTQSTNFPQLLLSSLCYIVIICKKTYCFC